MVEISYNLWLIGLSLLVTVIGCYASLSLAWRLTSLSGQRLRISLSCVALMLGATMWSAHFISMLAWEFPFLVAYDLQLTLVSALISMIVVGVALYIIRTNIHSNLKIIIGGTVLGAGFTTMHFVGMAAFQSSRCIVAYNFNWIVLSILFSVGVAIGSMWLVFRNHARLHIAVGALLLTISMCGIHYFAMLASDFVPSEVSVTLTAPILPSQEIAIVVTLVVFGIIGASLLAVMPDVPIGPGARRGAPAVGAGPVIAGTELAARAGGEAAGAAAVEKLAVTKDGKTLFLDLDEITYIKADAHYSTVHDQADSYFCDQSLSELEKRLPTDHFLRVHRSFIVNVGKVKGFEQTRDHGRLLFDRGGEQSVPISRRRFKEVHAALGT